ncbi:MarR family winged helix-turn-helix transcriptional regulator [Novosphingobium sp. B-7]|uniref:MarR family winged helix-turn-helix transcriptional regulator n=1 Tax=Novosphingobium sp. B-7 TaxID=1298855 RepID=UPI0011D1D9F8|nr:MarR family winged helix-turn-helix transcriptional regulator [Novosphingobium sp. B-7]
MGLLSENAGLSATRNPPCAANANDNAVKQWMEFKDCKEIAKAFYRFRRRRDDIFPKGIFADPAWDILLDLYISEVEGKKISITSACAAACVPATTALRWLSVLEERGLIVRIDDPNDNRRSFVRITGDAVYKITNLISKF